MKIGVFCRTYAPFSVRNYVKHTISELTNGGVDFVRFAEKESPPDSVDFYWDPGTGRPGPYYKLLNAHKSLVVTFHGVAHLALNLRECYGTSLKNLILGFAKKIKTLYEWHPFHQRCAAIITVSSYAKWEIQKYLGLDGDNIFPIHHGVDLKTFQPSNETNSQQPYFLHVSQYQPLKNVNRIIEAYARLPRKEKPRLLAIVPGYTKREPFPKGVEVIRTPVDHKELVSLYQGATAFIFPSLRESFGMPILEAMACGCPVITSNVTACPEVAGDAALLVNPRSVVEIAEAMRRLIEDEHLRQELREKGLVRAQQFTWRRSAERHLEVFEKVLRETQG